MWSYAPANPDIATHMINPMFITRWYRATTVRLPRIAEKMPRRVPCAARGPGGGRGQLRPTQNICTVVLRFCAGSKEAGSAVAEPFRWATR